MTSPFSSQSEELAVKDAQVQVPENFTSNLRAALSRPLFNVPDEFITWMSDQIALRGLAVPAGQIIGNDLRRIRELNYTEITSNVTVSSTLPTVTTVVTAASVQCDGTNSIVVEFYSPRITAPTGQELQVFLYHDGSAIGRLGDCDIGGTDTPNQACFMSRRAGPSAGDHTFSIRAGVTGGSGTIFASDASGTNFVPAYIRILTVA